VSNNQQAEFGMAPAAKKDKMQHNCFPKLFKFREVGSRLSLVTMSHPSLTTVAPPPCLPLYIKDSLKEDVRIDEGKLIEGLMGNLV
jgi:hypothetical protein